MIASLLLVTMGTDAVAPARMPHELARVGYAVTLLAPRDALATHTAFVDKSAIFRRGVTLYEWVQAVIVRSGPRRRRSCFPATTSPCAR